MARKLPLWAKLIRNPVAWIFGGLGLLVCCCAAGYVFGWFDNPTIRQAESRTNYIYLRVKAMRPATGALLISETQPKTELEGTLNCIVVRGTLAYDTHENYQAVLDQFTQAFSLLGWEGKQVQLTKALYNGTVFYAANDLSLTVTLQETDPHSSAYQTGYTIVIEFTEPRCLSG